MLFGLDSIPPTLWCIYTDSKWCVELLHDPIIHHWNHWKLFKKVMLEMDWSWSASVDVSYIPLNVKGKFFKWQLTLHLTSSLKCILPCFQSLCSACWLTRNSLLQQIDLVNILRGVLCQIFFCISNQKWLDNLLCFLRKDPFSVWG